MPTARILGIDVARAIAIGGMFVAHLAKDDNDSWSWVADGRPSALFALLAGCGLGFMTARGYPDRTAVRGKYQSILLRAMWLGILGIALMFLGTPVVVILSSYAVMFALTVPFLHLRPGPLLAWAAGVLIVAPPVVQALRIAVNGYPGPGMWIPGLFELATGFYPALSWLAYSLVGLAVVRLPLRLLSTQVSLFIAGGLAAVGGYGAGWWAQSTLEHRFDAVGLWIGSGAGFAPSADLTLGQQYAWSLVAIEPHTDSAPEMLGNIGVSLLIIALGLLVTGVRAGQVILHPITAAGSMSLTLYVAHLFYIAALGEEAVWNPDSQAPLLWLIAGSLVFALLWQRFLGRGPLERVLARLSSLQPIHSDQVL